jgi:outer membrane receptor protein involved in Fe transport
LASLGYQGEVKQQQLRVELYYGRKTQLVSLQPVSDLVPLPIAFTNLDAQDYFGGTLAASGRIVRNLDWFAQYALYLTRQLPSGTFTEQSPTHSAGLGGSYHWRDLTLSLQLYYQSGANQSRFVAGRLVTGLLTAHSLMINPFISYKVKPAGLELVLSGTNVADIRFGGVFVRDFVGFGAERRGPRVWLEVRGEWN